eukprot:12892426-Prorocentrum_lima.AAC.1
MPEDTHGQMERSQPVPSRHVLGRCASKRHPFSLGTAEYTGSVVPRAEHSTVYTVISSIYDDSR